MKIMMFAITAPVAVLKQIFANPNIEKAVNDFNNDWYSVYGENNKVDVVRKNNSNGDIVYLSVLE